MPEFVLRPKAATIKVTFPDGSFKLCTGACHFAEVIYRKYGVTLSKFQAMRLCHHHSYKRAQFCLPAGLTVERLNSTVATRRNLNDTESPVVVVGAYLDQNGVSIAAQQGQEVPVVAA